MDGLMVDPRRVLMFQALARLKEDGLRRVVRWSHADGLPFDTPTPAHQHTMPTVAIGLLGTTRVSGRETIDLGPGDLLLIEPGCWHRHEPQKPGSASFGLGFLAGFCDVLFFDEREVLWGAIPRDPMRGTVDALMDAAGEGERLDLADALVAQVLAESIRFVDWCDPDVLAMAAHLWNHLHHPIGVDDLLRKAGHRRTAGFALFKKFFGRSPRQELIHQRLDLARHLVRRGLSVTDAARRSGFTSRGDFTRAHRQRFGVPPSGDAAR